MIHIEHVSKTYKTENGSVEALKDISVDFPNSGFVALCGENGCGKTTLLNLISSMLTDFDGSIFIDNIDVRADSDYVRSAIVSYVLQDDYFVNAMTVADSLYLEKPDDELIDKALEELKISEKKLKYTSELSGGQRQRVAFIRGCIKDTPILLVDEPTNSMNEEMERLVFDLLKDLSKNKLVILVSHNLSLVREYCDIIVNIDNGSIVSSEQNCARPTISYSKNEILFYGKLNLNAIDKEKANQMIKEYGKVVISCNDDLGSDVKFDYSSHNHPNITVQKKLNQKQKKIAFGSIMKRSLASIIVTSVILGLLLVFVEGMIDLRSLDEDEFVFRTITENGERLASARRVCADDLSHADIIKSLKAITESKNIRSDVAYLWESFVPLDYAANENYADYLNGVSKSYLHYSNMKFGHVPSENKFAITDYIADALIFGNPGYSNYEDILKQGVMVGDYRLEISGVVRTDYDVLRKKPHEEWSYKDITNDGIREQKLYLLAFCDYRYDYSDGLTFKYVHSADCFADVFKGGTEGYNAVNEAMAEKLNYFGSGEMDVKTELGYFTIKGVITDDNPNPTIYLSENDYNGATEEFSQRFDFINIDIVDKDVVSFIRDCNFEIESYTGSYVYKIVKSIRTLSQIFLVLVAVFMVIIICIAYNYLKKFSNTNARLYVLERLSGYRKNEYFCLELYAVGLGILISLLTNLGAYYGGYALLNKTLTGAFKISICFMMNSIITWLLVASVFAVCMVILTVLRYLIREKKEPIELLKQSR